MHTSTPVCTSMRAVASSWKPRVISTCMDVMSLADRLWNRLLQEWHVRCILRIFRIFHLSNFIHAFAPLSCNCTVGHAKLSGRVLRVLRRMGCIKPVRCQCGCYIMKKHCLQCVWACENESSHLDARSKYWTLFVCTHFQVYPCRFVCKTALKIK